MKHPFPISTQLTTGTVSGAAGLLRQSKKSPVAAALWLITALTLLSTPATAQEFSDRSSEFVAGLENDSSVKAVEVGDFDGDGVDDLMISRRGESPILLMNEDRALVNRTTLFLAAADQARNSNYAEAFDANGDGFTDVVFARLGTSPLLFLNQGLDANGSWLGFDTGTALSGANNALVIESGDITGNGAADLFVIQVEAESNRLLVNDGNGNFTLENSRLGPLGGSEHQRGHTALLADVDSDGDIDIVYNESDLRLYVYYNQGDGTFNATLRSVFQNPDNFSYIYGAADFNGDGIFDYRQYSNPAPNAQMSTGTFDVLGIPEYSVRTDADMLRGNRKHGFVHMRDFDGDGDMDYVLSSILRNFGSLVNSREGHRTEMVINEGVDSGTFRTFVADAWASEESYDMKMLDINVDGNMDMFIAHDNRYAVYINGAPPSALTIASVQAAPTPAGVDAEYTVILDDNVAATFDWDFGDGSPVVTTTDGRATHRYAAPGLYQIVVTATNGSGSTQSVITARVHEPLALDTARSSASIVYESRADDDRLYTVNPDHDSITVINAVSGDVLAEISVDDEPRSLAMGSAGVLHVVNRSAATLLRIDTNSLAVIDSIKLPHGSRPSGLVISSDEPFAYIALEAVGKIIKLDLNSTQTVAELDSGPFPRELGLSADGLRLYAPRFISLPVADESTRTPATGGGEVLIIETSSMTISDTVQLPYNNPDNGVDTEIEARGIPNYLRAPAVSPSGRQAYIPAKLDNIYRGSMRDGNAREHDMLVRGIISQLNLIDRSENTQQRVHFDNLSAPVAATYGPTGNYLFTAHEGSRVVKVLDAFSGDIITSTSVGFAPMGIISSPDGTRVYVHNYLSRSVSELDTSGLMTGNSNTADVIRTLQTVANETLSPQVLLGKRLFHDSKDTRLASQEYISCASCHDDAGTDGRVWDFSDAGEGLRNTTDLRTRGGIDHGNVHWSANFDEFHDFENDIREIFDGNGLLDDVDFNDAYGPLDASNPKAGLSTDLDALAAYGASLTVEPASPFRSADGSLTSAGLRGKDVFRDANCAQCHSGTRFSDSPTGVGHDIGTVDADTGGRLGQPLLDGGLDTPTLRGLWLGAPYLHDGSAPTVQAAIRAHTRDMNTDITALSGAALDDLASYLLQIDANEIAAVSRDDSDGDGISDPVDPDDDNDGVEDIDDTPSNPNGAIRIDGNFAQWGDTSSFAGDADDVSGADNPLDLAQLWLAHDDEALYVRYDSHAPDDVRLTWGYSIQFDTDSDPTTGFRGFQNELPIGVDYMVEGNSLHRYTGNGNDFSWGPGLTLAAVLDGANLEMSIPRAALGNPKGFRLFLFANNSSVDGTSVDYYPDAVADPTAPPELRSFAYRFGDGEVLSVDPTPVDAAVFNPATIKVDGNLDDWSSLTSFGTDPDDVSGGSNTIDWREGWMAHDAQNFYLAWRNDAPAVLSWGNGIMLDTDQNTGTGFNGFNGEYPVGIDVLLEANTIHRYVGTGDNWAWEVAGSFAPAISGNAVEIQIPRSALNNSTSLSLFFSGQNAAVGGDALDFYPDAAGIVTARADRRRFVYSTQEPNLQPATPLDITVDGDLADWQSVQGVVVADADDMNGSNTIDWQSLRAQQSDDALYIAYETFDPIELTWGHSVLIDSDQNVATGFNGFSGELALGADFIIEGRQLQQFTGRVQSEWSWSDTNEVELVTGTRAAEIRIDLSMLNNTTAVDLLLRGENAAVNGEGIDYAPDTGKLSVSEDGPVLASALPIDTVTVGGGAAGLFFTGLLLMLYLRVQACSRRIALLRDAALFGANGARLCNARSHNARVH